MSPARKKPFIFSNLATSLDGKINLAGKGHFPLGTKDDWLAMQRFRKKADAIIFGATTLRGFKTACCVEDARWPRHRQPVNVVLSSKLEGISPRWSFFSDPRIRRILITGPDAPAHRVKAFEKSCEVVLLPKLRRGQHLATQVVTELTQRGLNRILVEGGGQVMWEFLKPNLIDELHMTLTPRILGGRDAPTLVEGMGFASKEVLNFRLIRARRLGDELYLTYRKGLKRGVTPAW